MTHTRATAWRKGTSQEARLAVAGNDAKFATFTFAVKGMLSGTYRLAVRGVVDDGAWMDDLGLFAEITVH